MWSNEDNENDNDKTLMSSHEDNENDKTLMLSNKDHENDKTLIREMPVVFGKLPFEITTFLGN